MVKGDTKNSLFVAPNGTRMKAINFPNKNGGTEEEKKLLGELNMLTKRANKEGE